MRSATNNLKTIYKQLKNYQLKDGLKNTENVTGVLEVIYTPEELRHVVFDTALNYIEMVERLTQKDE